MDIPQIFIDSFPGFLSVRNAKHEIVYMNKNFRDWVKEHGDIEPLGKTNDELSMVFEENVADVFRLCHDASLDWIKNSSSSKCLKRIIPFRKSEGETRYFEVLKYGQKLDGENHIFTVCFDITELYIENQKNMEASLTDPLTECYNRSFLSRKDKDYYKNKYFVYIDLDNFKIVNDSYGHNMGDEILRKFTSFVKSNTSVEDVLIRMGGDEFLLLAIGKNMEAVKIKIENLKVKFMKEFADYSFLSFTYGISSFKNTLETTLKLADCKMYKFKKN
jgi:diguanylate cyclase (GGDEF)-like protein